MKKITDKKIILSFVLPSLLGCALFIFVPSVFSFLLGFYDWDLISSAEFAGLHNYIDLFKSKEFYLVFSNTIIYSFFVTVFATILPLILASIINSKLRAKDFFKTAYFLPFITPMIVIAMVWQWIFDPNIDW